MRLGFAFFTGTPLASSAAVFLIYDRNLYIYKHLQYSMCANGTWRLFSIWYIFSPPCRFVRFSFFYNSRNSINIQQIWHARENIISYSHKPTPVVGEISFDISVNNCRTPARISYFFWQQWLGRTYRLILFEQRVLR